MVQMAAMGASVGSTPGKLADEVERASGGGLHLLFERFEFGWIPLSERATEVSGVDAFDDAGEFPVGEGNVEVELGQITTADLAIPLRQLIAVPKARNRGCASFPGRANIIGSGPIDHQQAEIGQGIAQGADLPVEDGGHGAIIGDHAVVEAVVAVNQTSWALIGNHGRQQLMGSIDSGQIAGALLIPLAVPTFELAGDITLMSTEIGESDPVDIDPVNRSHGVDQRAARSGARLGREGALDGGRVAQHMAIDKAHDIELGIVDLRIVAEPDRGWNRNIAGSERSDNAVFPAHIVCARQAMAERRTTQNESFPGLIGHRKGQIRVAAGDHLELERRFDPGDGAFEPAGDRSDPDTGDLGLISAGHGFEGSRDRDMCHLSTREPDRWASCVEVPLPPLRRDLRVLDQPIDLIVIGGGITGVQVAREAAGRGLRTVLLEQGDFGGGTSSATSKLIHGGIRYLEQAQFAVVRESLRERRVLALGAPHLVEQRRFVMPAWRWSKPPTALIGAGVGLYSALAFDRNRSAPPSLRIPFPSWMSAKRVQRVVPWLDPEGLQGAYVYHDTLNIHPERLLLAYVRSAAQHGAAMLNHMRVEDFILDGDTVAGVIVRDLVTDTTMRVRSTVVVNAAGPWVDLVLAQLRGRLGFRMVRSKGVHLLTNPIAGSTSNDTVFARARSGRHVIVTPWQQFHFIGPTDTEIDSSPDELFATPEDVEELLSTVNETLRPDVAPLGTADVVDTTIGVRPLLIDGDRDSYTASRRHEIYDHARAGARNLWSIGGGKWTTGRATAEQMLDVLYASAALRHIEPRRYDSRFDPAAGTFAWAADAEPYFDAVERSRPELGLSAATRRHLARLYGTDCEALLDMVAADPALATPISMVPGRLDIAAQVVYAVTDESAITLSDIIDRRLVIGTLGEVQADEIARVANLAGPLLGWSDERIAIETEREVARRSHRRRAWQSNGAGQVELSQRDAVGG